ncbi:MAG: S-adenosylmethionine decarboxylase [Candidatus Pacebacteria bacterium]|nr:S-adenosylmethionine decarboxylase [Candidatus Paceibacterota bacterium]
MNELKNEPFGYLLTLDLYGCKEGACDDLSLCYNFLEDIVTTLKMTKQSPPFIFRSDATLFPDKAGLSGWVPIIESGIQIHTLIPKNFISVDVYSCKKFSTEHIKEFAQNYFKCKEVEMNYVERGVKYNDIQ